MTPPPPLREQKREARVRRARFVHARGRTPDVFVRAPLHARGFVRWCARPRDGGQ